MLKNKTVEKPQARLRDFLTPFEKWLWYFYDEFSPEQDDACHDFEIEGGLIIKIKTQIRFIRKKLTSGIILDT